MTNLNHQHQKLERLESIGRIRQSGILSKAEISRQTGIPRATVSRLMKELDGIYRERAGEAIEVAKGEDLARIDTALQLVMTHIERGNLYAIDRLVLLIGQRAKILGLDAPTTVRHTFDQAQAQKVAEQTGIPVEELIDRATKIMELQA